jgi:dTDP-4-dehydrorhamnose 3,5-epimerase
MTELNVNGVKDGATVTSGSERIEKFIDGVRLRRATTHMDERGELAEIYSKAWGFDPGTVEHVYAAMIRPGRVKGWVYHKEQSDRQFLLSGFVKYVLWDPRPASATHGMVNEIYLSERNRALVMIPPYVIHAVQNVGQTDAFFINLPTVPYNHASPDKYRVPPESVPYSFDKGIGW